MMKYILDLRGISTASPCLAPASAATPAAARALLRSYGSRHNCLARSATSRSHHPHQNLTPAPHHRPLPAAQPNAGLFTATGADPNRPYPATAAAQGLRNIHPCSRAAAPAATSAGTSSTTCDRANGSGPACSRRAALLQVVAGGGAVGLAVNLVSTAGPAAALPLGPLGPVTRVGGDKRTGLTAEEVAEILRQDLAVGQYFVTGDLTREIFADDCRFVDPTNDVTGLSKYLTALGVLFDPQYSKVELLGIRASGPRTVEADWRLGGYLVFPWNPRVEPFEGHTIYTLNDEGLVSEQRQTWGISGATALLESFTPTFGPRRQLF